MQVQNCYKIIKDTQLGTKTPSPKQRDVRPRHSLSYGLMTTSESVDDAANAAAYRVADAENKAYMAAEAVKEAERISKMAEDTDSMLQLVKEIYERCNAESTIPI
jgi:myb proto-oncogene protein